MATKTADAGQWDGLWTVELIGAGGTSGAVWILRQGRVVGGDQVYIYTGTYDIADDAIEGAISAERYHPGKTALFDDLANFDLVFFGRSDGPAISGRAYLAQPQHVTFQLRLRKRMNVPW